MALTVNEIFYSVQGETSFAGLPCVFIRLTGCNLRCSYCDTRYAYSQGEPLEVCQILEQVAAYECPLVEVTGGEPLIQKETPLLVSSLISKGYKVLLETNGSQNIGLVENACVKIMDVKCPCSGEYDKNDLENLSRLMPLDEIKFVIGGKKDYEYAREILSLKRHGAFQSSQVHFSPLFGRMDPKILVEWILRDHMGVRLNLQLHKIIWSPEMRGV